MEKEITTKTSDSLIASFVPKSVRDSYLLQPGRIPGTAITGEYAALLWVDIQDFSSLSKAILKNEKDGLEHLSLLLHEHYDPLINLISKTGGEPIFFAGDGVLCAWFSDTEDLSFEVRQAMACGQKLIENNSLKDVEGNSVGLHVVVAAGSFHLAEVSDLENRIFITPLGAALKDLRNTTETRAPGEVLLSENVVRTISDQIQTAPVSDKASILNATVEPLMTKLNESSDDPDNSILLPYIPVSIQYQLDSERINWIAELRRVTVLYVSLSGFDPARKKAAQSLRKAVKIASKKVYHNEGILGQVWIDEKDANLLIYFGPPPSSHQDNPFKAIKTSVELYNELHEAGFDVSIGVVSGTNYCGLLGNNIFRQYTILGDNVIIGSRLASNKKEGIWCDDNTRNFVKNTVAFEYSSTINIKGFGEAVTVWEPKTDQDFSKNYNIKLSIGREKELTLLNSTWQHVKSGNNGALILEGESGFGKTKLLNDFSSLCAKSGDLIYFGKPERIERNIPYQAVKSVFEAIFQIDRISDPDKKSELVFQFLGDEFSGRASLLNVILQLNFNEPEEISILSGLQKSQATRTLLINLVRKFASEQAFIIILDDAQWMDAASWDLVREISKSVAECFTICVVQDIETIKEAKALIDSGATRLELQPLQEDDLDELIVSILGKEQLTAETAATIKSISKGNPYFCIELTRSFKEYYANADVEALSMSDLPQTIRGTIRRNIDLLEPGPQMALKVASVTGQRFSTTLVQNVYPIQREKTYVPDYLVEDNKQGLLNRDLENGEEYVFNHSMIRDVAYESLLRGQRTPIHMETALWYEKTYSNNLMPHLVKIAYHLEQAGEYLKAAEYLEKEAIRIFSQGYAKESVDVGLQAVRLLNIHIETEPEKIGPEIGANMMKIGELMAGRHPSELLNNKRLDNKETETVLKILLGIGPCAFQSQQIELFALIAVLCLRITLEEGNGVSAADVYSMYSPVHAALTGNRVEANTWSQLALDLDSQNGEVLHSRVAFVHTWFHNHWKNPLSTSIELSKNAAIKGFETGDFLFGCFNLSAHVVYQEFTGVPLTSIIQTARENLEKNGRQVMNAAFHLIHEMQIAKAFSGLTIDPLSFTDEEFSEEKDIASICDTEFANQIGYYFVSKIKMHQHFGDWEGALKWAATVQPLIPAFKGQVAEIDFVQFESLAMLHAMFFQPETESQFLHKTEENVKILQEWTALSAENYQHKLLMIEGFLDSFKGNSGKGIEKLQMAAELAGQQSFLNDLGIIFESLAIVQTDPSEKTAALKGAIDAYNKWGATAKVNYLNEKYS
ncbi:AAA family ATPase [Maribellus sediminis]|uniref:AAA family ATPase n=1 Tax=Maribellus sediminis TaxID=2696285 RepID=UPI00142F8CBE|nr:AAA family ATPase [Maribellus sediminis]